MDSLRVGNGGDHEILLRFAPRLGVALSIDGIHSPREPRRLAVVRHVLALGGSRRVLCGDGETAPESQRERLLPLAIRVAVPRLQPTVGELRLLAFLHCSILSADLFSPDAARQDHPRDDFFRASFVDVRIFLPARSDAPRRAVRVPAR